jgi:hypothetical protein
MAGEAAKEQLKDKSKACLKTQESCHGAVDFGNLLKERGGREKFTFTVVQ